MFPPVFPSPRSFKELSKRDRSRVAPRQSEASVCTDKALQNELLRCGAGQMSLDLQGWPIASPHRRVMIIPHVDGI